MERSRLNLRIVDKWRPVNIRCQPSKSGIAKGMAEILSRCSWDQLLTYIFSLETTLAAQVTQSFPEFTEAIITEDLASGFDFGKQRVAGKGREWTAAAMIYELISATYAVI